MFMTGLTLPWLAGLAAAVGAALVVLHILRPRPVQQRVVTLLFWKQAYAEPRAPRLFKRFRHVWTFVLLSLLAAALIGALTGWRWKPPEGPVVLVVDQGMSMGAKSGEGTRSQEALRAALAYADSVDARRELAVVIVDPLPRVVFSFDQPRPALSRLLEPVKPADGPAASAQAIHLAHTMIHGQAQAKIVWITDRSALPAELSAGEAKEVERRVVGKTAANAAILSATFEPGAGGQSGNVRVRVVQWGGQASTTLKATGADGRAVAQVPVNLADGQVADVVLPQQAADGSRMKLELTGGGAIAADDVATVTLPRRPMLRFAIGADVPEPLRLAARAIGREADRAEAGAIWIGMAEPAARGGAAIVVVSGTATKVEAGQLLTMAPETTLGEGLDIEDARCGAGSAISAKGTALVLAGQAVVADYNAAQRRLYLSDALFAPAADVTRRAAFLSLLVRASEQLGGWSSGSAALTLERQDADPLFEKDSKEDTAVIPGSRGASNLVTAIPAGQAEPAIAPRTLQPFEWLILAAVAGLSIEALLYMTRRVV